MTLVESSASVFLYQERKREIEMFEVGMGFIRKYATEVAVGEITSIHQDADGETLIDVMFEDGATKVYTENCVMQNLGRRMIVTETSFAK